MATINRNALQIGNRVKLTAAASKRAWSDGLPWYHGNTGIIIELFGGDTAVVRWDNPISHSGNHNGNHLVHKLQRVK